MRDRIFLSTEYGLIPVKMKDDREDERFVYLHDSTGLVNVPFARVTVEKYLRGEIQQLRA